MSVKNVNFLEAFLAFLHFTDPLQNDEIQNHERR